MNHQGIEHPAEKDHQVAALGCVFSATYCVRLGTVNYNFCLKKRQLFFSEVVAKILCVLLNVL